MLKLTTIAVAILVSSPALACYDEAHRPVARYSYGYTAPMSYARYAYADDDDYGGYYGYGRLGLAVGAGIADAPIGATAGIIAVAVTWRIARPSVAVTLAALAASGA
jgi:hypothetical protein